MLVVLNMSFLSVYKKYEIASLPCFFKLTVVILCEQTELIKIEHTELSKILFMTASLELKKVKHKQIIKIT